MKKLLLIAAVMIISVTASFAQLGVRMGMNFGDLGGDDVEHVKSSIGLHLGVVDNFELGSGISIQPGAYYTQKNWKIENGRGKDEDLKARTHHLEVPVLVKYNIEFGDIAIDPHVGPYFDFAFAGKFKDVDDVKIYRNRDNKGDWNYSNFDMGLTLGCGATYSDIVYCGLDYQFGFKDIAKSKNTEVRSHVFMITFGVWFK